MRKLCKECGKELDIFQVNTGFYVHSCRMLYCPECEEVTNISESIDTKKI